MWLNSKPRLEYFRKLYPCCRCITIWFILCTRLFRSSSAAQARMGRHTRACTATPVRLIRARAAAVVLVDTKNASRPECAGKVRNLILYYIYCLISIDFYWNIWNIPRHTFPLILIIPKMNPKVPIIKGYKSPAHNRTRTMRGTMLKKNESRTGLKFIDHLGKQWIFSNA